MWQNMLLHNQTLFNIYGVASQKTHGRQNMVFVLDLVLNNNPDLTKNANATIMHDL